MDSLPYLAFKAARAFAYIALVPGLWIVWLGWRKKVRHLRLSLFWLLAVLVATCVFAAFTSSGNQADGWDALGTIYWSTIAAAELIFCAIVGVVIGKFRVRNDASDLSE
jgi:hypothetical protein